MHRYHASFPSCQQFHNQGRAVDECLCTFPQLAHSKSRHKIVLRLEARAPPSDGGNLKATTKANIAGLQVSCTGAAWVGPSAACAQEIIPASVGREVGAGVFRRALAPFDPDLLLCDWAQGPFYCKVGYRIMNLMKKLDRLQGML